MAIKAPGGILGIAEHSGLSTRPLIQVLPACTACGREDGDKWGKAPTPFQAILELLPCSAYLVFRALVYARLLTPCSRRKIRRRVVHLDLVYRNACSLNQEEIFPLCVPDKSRPFQDFANGIGGLAWRTVRACNHQSTTTYFLDP